MNQVLHILRKDLRHHWPEIAASLALLVAFSYYEVRSWRSMAGYGVEIGSGWFFAGRFLPGLIQVLLPISWAFLVLRVIQSEPLVGDRQFWITRPYEWKSLLAAKVLFLLVCVNLPWLISNLVLLARAGFAPMAYVAGLLWLQLLMLVTLVLPIATMATVTATVLQALLGIVIVALYLIGAAFSSDKIPNAAFSSGSESLQFSVFLVTCIAVVLVQYARRQTLRSRLLIVGLGATILLMLVVTPYRMLIDREYPHLAAGEPPPLRLGMVIPEPPPPPESQAETDFLNRQRKTDDVSISIPFNVSSIADNSIIVVNGLLIDLEGPQGERWSSGWHSQGNFIPPLLKRITLSFELKKSLYDRWKNQPVQVRLSLAATQFRDANRRDFVVPAGEFSMPGVGWCAANSSIQCRAPLRSPRFVYLQSQVAASTCPRQPDDEQPATNSIAWGESQHLDSEPAEFGLSPIKDVTLYLSQTSSGDRLFGGLCPGTPLVVSNPEFVRAFQTEVKLDSIRLVDYRPLPLDIRLRR